MKLIATQQREWSYRWNDAHAPTWWAKDASEKEVNKPLYVFTKQSVSKKTRKRASVSLSRRRFAALFKRAVAAARICRAIDAGNPLWQAPACYKWVDAPRDMQRLKITPSHLMLAERTGKCVWRPLVLFLYLPVTHTAAAQAEPARHTVWLWRELVMNVKCGGSVQEAVKREQNQNLFVHRHICLYALEANNQLLPWTQKQSQNKQRHYSHTSMQQDVLSKTNMLVSPWSAHLFMLVASRNHTARMSLQIELV